MADRVSWGCVAAVLLVLGVAAAASGGVGSAGGGAAANAEIVAVDLAGRQTNLTQNPAADVAPSVARDGRIAFLSTRDGLADLYVMNSRGENVRRLTSRAGITLGEDLEWSQASWAPDGQRIAFDAKYDTGVSHCTQRCASWKVMVVGADGSGPNEIMRDARAAAWSPNGRRLAYVGGVNAYGSADNVTLSRDDGSDPVSVSAHAGFSDVGPAWSPSGTQVAFTAVRADGTHRSIYVASAEGRRKRRLTAGHDAAWSPDGRQLVFIDGFRLIAIDSQGKQRLRLSPKGEYVIGAAWSPKGDAVAYIAGTTPDRYGGYPRNLRLEIVGANGKHVRVLARERAGTSLGTRPVWTPSGKRIIVVVAR